MPNAVVIKRPAALKRPACFDDNGNDVMKKPASWYELGEHDVEEVSDADSDDNLDTSALTQQQRHVWRKALKVHSGMPGALPPEVRKKYDDACASSVGSRNAVVNALVPKDAGYGFKLDIKAKDIKRFQSTFAKQTDMVTADGISYTDLAMQWGCGNYQSGQEAIKIALANKELVDKDGLLYRRNRKFTYMSGNEVQFDAQSEDPTIEDLNYIICSNFFYRL